MAVSAAFTVLRGASAPHLYNPVYNPVYNPAYNPVYNPNDTPNSTSAQPRHNSAADSLGIPVSEYAARRQALLASVGEGIVVALGSAEPPNSYITFWQHPSFEYLTGYREPNAVLIMTKRRDVTTQTLFVEQRSANRETWDGARTGPAEVTQALQIPGRGLDELVPMLDSLLGDDSVRVYVIGDFNPRRTVLSHSDQFVRSVASRHTKAAFVQANRMVLELRSQKSPAELALLRRAIEISAAAHEAALGMIAPGRTEYQVQAAIEYTFKAWGADRPAFLSIVGSGPNSTVLHYRANRRTMLDGDLVVIDIGASYRGYAGDVTRTYPVNKRFTSEQRRVYQAVRNAQQAAEKAAQVGVHSDSMRVAATRVIERELADMGLIEAPGASFVCRMGGQPRRCPQYALYYMHGLGHAIGLEVHDAGSSGIQSGILAAGDAFTIEPGIYVRANALDLIEDVPANRRFRDHIRSAVGRYANIGVRIEDDYLVTSQGVEWISRIPRDIDEIEAAMRSVKR